MIQFVAGSTSKHVDLFIADSASTIGAGKTGIAYNAAGLKAYYRKGQTGSATAITLATQTVGGAYSSGGFVEIDSTNMPGAYRLDLPNAALDTEGFVTLYVFGASGAAPTILRIEVVSTTTVRSGVNVVQVSGDSVAADNLEAAFDGTGYASAMTIAWNASWDAEVQSECADAITAAGLLDASGVRNAIGLASANLDTQLTAMAGYIDTEVATILSQTSAASIRSAVGLASANLDSQIATLATAANLATAIGYIDTEITTIISQTTAAAIRAALGLGSANLDTQLAAIVADTNELQVDWTNGGRLDLIVDAILDDTGTAGVAIASATANKIADHVLRRGLASAVASSDGDAVAFRSLLGAVRKLVNKLERAASTLNIYNESDASVVATQSLTTDSNAAPITVLDTN